MLSTYKKKRAIHLDGFVEEGWNAIISVLAEHCSSNRVMVIDCYTGVNQSELEAQLVQLKPDLIIRTRDLFITAPEVAVLTNRFMTDDTLFGYISNISLEEYFDVEKLTSARKAIAESNGSTVVLGEGAQLVAKADTLVYADMPRWEIQQRMRKQQIAALGIDNRKEAFSHQYKRGLFNDWRVLDKHKRAIYTKVDYWLDTVVADEPKMIDSRPSMGVRTRELARPFRVSPSLYPPRGGEKGW